MKKIILVCCATLMVAGVTYADIVLAPTETTISGSDANRIAEMMISGGDSKGTYAEGDVAVSCVKKTKEKDFTCVLKVK